MSPNVIGVGGTTLSLTSNNSWSSETTWSGSGGGVSQDESKPGYQSGETASGSKRGSPDVAYDASPNSGFYVYDSNYNGQGGWWDVGGTSGAGVRNGRL